MSKFTFTTHSDSFIRCVIRTLSPGLVWSIGNVLGQKQCLRRDLVLVDMLVLRKGHY